MRSKRSFPKSHPHCGMLPPRENLRRDSLLPSMRMYVGQSNSSTRFPILQTPFESSERSTWDAFTTWKQAVCASYEVAEIPN